MSLIRSPFLRHTRSSRFPTVWLSRTWGVLLWRQGPGWPALPPRISLPGYVEMHFHIVLILKSTASNAVSRSEIVGIPKEIDGGLFTLRRELDDMRDMAGQSDDWPFRQE